MKQNLNKEWNKHWFVLRGCRLMYYRDPGAENKGMLDGVIDLNIITAVTPVQVARNYGFQTLTWIERGSTVLSAVTAGIRSSWMSAIRRAANLPHLENSLESQTFRQDSLLDAPDSQSSAAITLTPRSILFSSDEAYRTASEGGRRESSEWSEVILSPSGAREVSNYSDCHKQQQYGWSELPPSPPLSRSGLSKVKARSRSSSRSRVYKRSRSSPPSSRRSTLDSLKSEELVVACCDFGSKEALLERSYGTELLENQPDTKNQPHSCALLLALKHQEAEIEGLKFQLNVARTKHSHTTSKYEDEIDKSNKLYTRDKELLQSKLSQTEPILRETSERCQMLTNQLSFSHATVERLQVQVTALSDRLAEGIEENERLYIRLRELEGKTCLSSSRDRARSFDSLSDLTNIDLDLDLNALDKERVIEEYDEMRSRFEKAILEIRAMRKEFREAHAMQDVLELEIFVYKQEADRTSEYNQAQVELMAARVQDLTNKLAGSEKHVRSLKQKLSKTETRDKRRSLSLKGRESFQISQEVEDKLLDLENKICAIERGKSARPQVETFKDLSSNLKKERKTENRSFDRSRLRRKSLDSATSSEPMQVLIRLSTLETKVANVTDNIISDAEKDSSECSEVSVSTSEVSLEILSKIRKLERAVAKSKRRIEKCLETTQAEEKVEKCLPAVNDILDLCMECKKNQANSQVIESIGIVVSKLEIILRNKMSELMKRRQQLAQTGQLDDKEKVKLIAERIAFEFVILRQIKDAMERTLDKSTVLSELVETSQLISNLKFKVNGTKPKTYQNTTYVQYLTRVLANKLVLIGCVPKTLEKFSQVSAAQGESLNFLMQKQKEVNKIVSNYKNDQLKRLAEALVTETFSLSEQEELCRQDTVSGNKFIEDQRIREAWALAQETVSKELVHVEVSHFIMQCGQIYEQSISSITDTCLNFDTSQNVNLESWTDKAQTILRQEIEYAIDELTGAYKEWLLRLKKNKINAKTQYDSRQLLSEYTDVIAQKALIDARIIVLQEDIKNKVAFYGKTFVSSLIQHEDILSSLLGENYTFENNPIQDAEYIYLYQQFSNDCKDIISNKQQSKEHIKSVAQILTSMVDDIDNLKQCLSAKMNENDNNLNWPKIFVSVTDWISICDKCSEIREQITRLTDHLRNVTCRYCEQLQEEIQWFNAEHTKELEELRKSQEKNLSDIKGEWDNQRNSLTTQHEYEADTLRERVRKLEHRLNAMDSEHFAHMNELRAAYQRSIRTELGTDSETRNRYKEEIKQLRALCEKGLLAMENSHRRIISELEEKHRQELENLRIEKEQALSEETQATLAALDAMRKAHEHEVQKEIAKFKQEFIKQVQACKDIEVLQKEHEEEMEEIKQENLSLSAKYSSKCVESAALEEKVGTLTKQVAQAQQYIVQLDARNKQLRAHLVLDTNDSSLNNTIQLIRGRDNEIAEQRGKIHRLQQQLKHGDHVRDSTGLLKKSTVLSYSPVYSSQGIRSSHEQIVKIHSVDGMSISKNAKSTASNPEKALPVESSKSLFLYNLERLKSISLPCSNRIITTECNLSEKGVCREEEKIGENNGIMTSLWHSSSPKSGLSHQYQGTEES